MDNKIYNIPCHFRAGEPSRNNTILTQEAFDTIKQKVKEMDDNHHPIPLTSDISAYNQLTDYTTVKIEDVIGHVIDMNDTEITARILDDHSKLQFKELATHYSPTFRAVGCVNDNHITEIKHLLCFDWTIM